MIHKKDEMLENISPSVYLYFEIRFFIIINKMKVQIQMNISKHTLYFNVIFNNSDSLPTCFTAAVAIAIDCGEINFAYTTNCISRYKK